MGNNAKSINRIEFWGQEPTLTLHHITANIEEWKKVFPNVNNFMFSTNGVGYTDRILDFIQAIDNYGNTMRFEMQFSYDGEESNEANRGLNSASVSKNIEYFITKLNEMPLNNTKVEIHFHNVVSIQLINSITTIEEINNYIKNLYGKTEYFASLNKHNKVLVANHPDAGIEVPVDASTEDGLNFHRFYKLLNCAEENIKRDYIVSRNILNFQQRTFNSVKDMMIEEENITPFELMYKYTNDNDIIFGRKQDILNECSYCGAYLTELKVMYDGTLINCHS